MWYLNYCAPFIYQTGGSTAVYRTIMYSLVFALFLVYLIFIVLYKVSGKLMKERPKLTNQHEDTLKDQIRISFCSNEIWFPQKEFKQWYLCYFGMHSVAVATCIMYSPYLSQTIFVIIHFIVFLIATILKHRFQKGSRKPIEIVYMVLICISMVLNVMLLFSGSMGVGASGYDENAKICLLQSQTRSNDL